MMLQDSIRSPASVDEDPTYRDLIDSISVSAEEMSVLITMPEIQSVQQARRYVQKVQIEPVKASRGWYAREMETITAHARQLATALSFGLTGLRRPRLPRQL